MAQRAVKSPANYSRPAWRLVHVFRLVEDLRKGPTWRRFAVVRSGCLVGLCVFLLSMASTAQQAKLPKKEPRQRPSLLLGGAMTPTGSPVRLDPVLPRGQLLGLPVVIEEEQFCSSARPVCVAGGVGATSARSRALRLLERAYEEHVYGGSFPPPIADFVEPLVWQLEPERELTVHRMRLASRGFDRARAQCRGGRGRLEEARKCIVSASLFAQSPATASWLANGLSAQFAAELGAAPATRDALRSSFENTHVGVLTSTRRTGSWRDSSLARNVSPERSARFFRYLEARSEHGSGEAAWLALSLAATRTRPGSMRWEAEPDLLDVLAATTRGDNGELARLFDDFAQQSLFQAEEWGTHLVSAWELDSSSLPRNLALADPLEPTGSTYVRVALDQSDQKEVIAFRMSCESPVSYVWSVVRLNEQGQLHSSLDITYQERGGNAEARVLPQPGVSTLVLVGTNMGGIDLAHPFDPDHEPHEAHGCQVYISLLPN